MKKNNKARFKMTSKGLKKAVTISAVVLTLVGPTMPTIANAAMETPATETPATETPAMETPATETPAMETPAAETRAVGDVNVSTYAEFKAALNNTVVQNIYLNADITIEDSFNFKSNKNVNGNGHKIDVNNKKIGIALKGATASLEDVNLINQNVYSFFWSEDADVTVNYKNVTSSGKQFIWLPKGTVNLSGNITATAILEEGIDAGKLNLKSDSNVTINVTSNLEGVKLRQGLDQEVGSVLNVNSKGMALHEQNSNTVVNVAGEMNLISSNDIAFYHNGSAGELNIGSEAKFKAIGNSSVHEAIMVHNGSLNLSSRGTLVASSIGSEATIQTGGSMKFETGSNFMVINTKGPVLGSYALKTDVGLGSDRGISTWVVGNVSSDVPDKFYSALEATFTLKGYTKSQTQTNMISDNSEFQTNFKSGNVGKITGGTFTQKNIEQTMINELTTDSTQAVGTAEPNADISIKVGEIEIGKGKVGSDGKYSITISKQAAGVTVKAIATINNVSSEASTIVKQASIEQTTIDELTTNSTQAVGTAEPNADISIKVGETEIGKGKVGSDGKYSITISKQAAGVTVKAIATIDNVSSEAFTVVKSIIAGTIMPATYKVGSSNITGTYTGDVKKAQLFVNDKASGWGGTFTDGSFTYYVAGANIKVGDKVVLAAYDANDKELDRKAVVVEAGTTGAITSATYKIGESNITGEFTGDVARVQLKVNGVAKGAPAGTFNSDGTFTYWAKGLDIKSSDDVTLTALDSDNNQLQESFTVVLNDSEGTISGVTYKVGDSNIAGKFTGDVARVQLKLNGENVGIPAGTFNSNGTFTYWAKGLNIQATDEVTLDALDIQNNVLQAGVAVEIQE